MVLRDRKRGREAPVAQTDAGGEITDAPSRRLNPVGLDEQVEVDAKQGFYRKGIVGNDSLGGCSSLLLVSIENIDVIGVDLPGNDAAAELGTCTDQGEAQVGLKVTAPTLKLVLKGDLVATTLDASFPEPEFKVSERTETLNVLAHQFIAKIESLAV